MDGISLPGRTPVSIARRRLKTIAFVVVIISVLCMVGGTGYLAYKKVIDLFNI